jgi:hypothetical protein
MSKAEEEFIKKAGQAWSKAMIAATVHVMNDSRFVGLDKIRKPVIHQACIKALGGEFGEPQFLARIGIQNPELSRILNKLIEDASKEAKKALRG